MSKPARLPSGLLESVLIANRGEIACRIIQTAKRLGIRTIAVYSEADAKALHVRLADEAYLIGPAPARESYLRADKILEVAKRSKAASIHPGYGFLSENAEFAEDCARAGIVFVGPPASAIRAMGLKDAAKALVEKANVPVVPGYHGASQDGDFLRERAREIGYPVLIKAVAGGGGKGMRRVNKHAEFDDALAAAQREGASAFGDPRVLIEKYITSPRHVEMQIFADSHGNVVHLFERDCSLQRRHQKVIEEAPAPGMTEGVRAAMGEAAVEAARAVGYVGAGTIEFIADASDGLKVGGFYFMEMNTRLQVEHPVTEAITGLDLVELQFRVAAGEKLSFSQDDLKIYGHAVEARLYAEDPETGFLPSTGKLWALRLPDEGGGIRVDTGVEQGGTVTPHYDPMIAKIIAHGATRNEALDRLSEALSCTVVAGPKTNTAFLKALCNAEGFRANKFDTGFIDRNLVALGAIGQPVDALAVAAAASRIDDRERERLQPLKGQIYPEKWSSDPWDRETRENLAEGVLLHYTLNADGKKIRISLSNDNIAIPALEFSQNVDVTLSFDEHGSQILTINGDRNTQVVSAGNDFLVIRKGRQTRVSLFDPLDVDLDDLGGSDGSIKSPMHGKLISVFVAAGDTVTKGQKLAIVEAMKMEHALLAKQDGVISEVYASVGMQMAEGARILQIG